MGAYCGSCHEPLVERAYNRCIDPAPMPLLLAICEGCWKSDLGLSDDFWVSTGGGVLLDPSDGLQKGLVTDQTIRQGHDVTRPVGQYPFVKSSPSRTVDLLSHKRSWFVIHAARLLLFAGRRLSAAAHSMGASL